ncbi:ATP-binding protein [Streptomyces sp. NPDC005706]|uniref:ATP-binding protein n=1 Tax=Streptomyces sp. NPDC005706 TaxID=3157169 RepID=UPI00340D7A56
MPAPASSLAADDAPLGPCCAAHLIRSSALARADALRRLTAAGEVDPTSPWTLLYGALENFATGLRLLDGAGRSAWCLCRMPVATTVLPREPQSAFATRWFVTHTLAHWQLQHLTNRAELVVAELSANAIQHARHAMFRVTLRRSPQDRVRVAVIDKSTTEPVLCHVDDDAETGRGLALVDRIALRWGTDPARVGKTRLGRRRSPATAADAPRRPGSAPGRTQARAGRVSVPTRHAGRLSGGRPVA